MPLDDTLPPSRLSERATTEEISDHFAAAFGVRVDLGELETLPPSERLSLAVARLPEPPEAHLLDRVLQIVPAVMWGAIGRITLLDGRAVGRYGTYRGKSYASQFRHSTCARAIPTTAGATRSS